MTQACLADLRGRKYFESAPYPQGEFLNRLGKILCDADFSAILQQGLKGKELGVAIYNFRLDLIKQNSPALKSG